MFLYSLIIAIIIGFVLKGKLINLTNIDLIGLPLAISGFIIDETMHQLILHGLLRQGIATFSIDFVMYIMILYFEFLNRKDFYIVLMGIGFFLNAIPIFANGGEMPVSPEAIANVTPEKINPSSLGLYNMIGPNTKFSILGDILSVKAFGHIVFSIGDIVLCIGMMLIVINGMRGKYNKVIIHSRGRSSRRSRRIRRKKLNKRQIALRA